MARKKPVYVVCIFQHEEITYYLVTNKQFRAIQKCEDPWEWWCLGKDRRVSAEMYDVQALVEHLEHNNLVIRESIAGQGY